MAQNYRIYINENSLYLGKEPLHDTNESQQIDYQNFDFLTFLKNLKPNGNTSYQLISDNPKSVLKRIKTSCKVIKAAGGLVVNNRKEHLFIFRNNKWDLPKGKVEKSEQIKKAAVREVEEECGLTIDQVQGKLCKTYHVYVQDGKTILKRTSWYLMEVDGAPSLTPQTEEGITAVEWVANNKVKQKMKNTYPLIKEVLIKGRVL